MKTAFLLTALLAAAAGFSFLPQAARGDDGDLPVAGEIFNPPEVSPIRIEDKADDYRAQAAEPAGASGGEAKKVEARDKRLLAEARKLAGVYVLESNGTDKAKPCYFQFGLKEGEEVRLNATVTQADDEHGRKAGQVNLELRQWNEQLKKEVSVFDRADFSGLNSGSTASYVDRLKISHVSSLHPAELVPQPRLSLRDPNDNDPKLKRFEMPEKMLKTGAMVSHTVTMSQLGEGRSDATQRLVFNEDGSGFTYDYQYTSGRILRKVDGGSTCKFKKKQ